MAFSESFDMGQVMFKQPKRPRSEGHEVFICQVEDCAHPCTNRVHQIVERSFFFLPPIGPLPLFLNYNVQVAYGVPDSLDPAARW